MKKDLRSYVVTIGIHVCVFSILYLVFSFLGFIKGYPTNASLVNWDVGWYKSIVEGGYAFVPGQQSNVAFFPLFPMLWRLTSLSAIGMSALNLVFLYAGVFLLYRRYSLDRKTILLILSVPSLFFCYVPYSEALFFLAGSLIIYGLKQNYWMAVLGVFLACLTRSASLVFIPVILFANLYNYKFGEKNGKMIRQTVLLILSAVVSTLLAQYIQYIESGEFFTMFKTLVAWDRVLELPVLPFTSWDEARLIWLDGMGFLVGLATTVTCIHFVVKKIRNNAKPIPPDYLFSIAYLSLVTIVAALYSSEDARGTTSLFSLNRYIFSTPFFMVFLIVLLKKNRVVFKDIAFFLGVSLATWLLFNAGGYLRNLEHFALPFFKTKIYFAIATLYGFSFVLLSNKRYHSSLWSGIYIFNLLLQIFLFTSFMNGVWIG